MATTAELLSSLMRTTDALGMAPSSLLPRRAPLEHKEREQAHEWETLLNNLSVAIFEESERERVEAGTASRASEAILLQKLEQGPLQGRARVPLERPTLVLDLEHHQDNERLPLAGQEGLCCGKKHYWKGAVYDMVLPVKVLNEIATFPLNVGDNPFEIASNYCRRNGIHDFQVLEGIVKVIKEEVPEQFLDLTAAAPPPAEKRSKAVTPFVPILQRAPKKKAQKRERKESACQESVGKASASTVASEEGRASASASGSASVAVATVAVATAVTVSATVSGASDGAVEKKTESENVETKREKRESEEPANSTATVGGESIAAQLRMAQERRRQQHVQKRMEESKREKEKALERERQLVREYIAEQEERDRVRRELQALTPQERLELLKQQLSLIEREEARRR